MAGFLGRWVGMGVILLTCMGNFCGDATETGNPFGRTAPATEAEEVQNAMCDKLTQCYPHLTFENCIDGIDQVTNIDTEIGLNPGDYADFQAVIDAEKDNTLNANTAASTQCQNEIRNLFCNQPPVANALNPNDPDHFDNVYVILSTNPGSCPDLYAP